MRNRDNFLICTCVQVLLLISAVFGFNLEVRIPVVKEGFQGSYFGYSVAEHKDGSNTPWMLVGAPLGKNLQPNTTRSGSLWRCPLSTKTDDCIQVITDGRRNLYDDRLQGPNADEHKEDQWLGVSVSSASNTTNSGKIAVCAHRYVLKKGPDARWGQGLCYTLTGDFAMDDTWEPCKGKSVAREHEEYGFCQVGTSSALIEDSLILGAPGPYTWTGTMYVMSVTDDFLERDRTKYDSPLATDPAVPKYSYLGMAVTAGHYLDADHLSFVSGAPRAGGTGQVVLLKKTIPPTSTMSVVQILHGEQFGSSFGYEVATADIDGDSWPDLLVGAPFFFTRDNGGAVYVYRNKKGGLPGNYTTRLVGPRLESRFGFALASMGDINLDGCDDVAIGAPYEHLGVVYVHLGSRDGLQEKPAQVIRASERSAITKPTFGYSLSGGLDLDGNGYPDLLIGAYSSDSVVLLRARPIIDIHTQLKSEEGLQNVDPSKSGCAENLSTNYTCFSFETCANIVGPFSDVSLRYYIIAETFLPSHKFSRVWFDEPNDPNRLNVVSEIVKLRGGEHCKKHVMYLKENTRDILQPIKFRLNYTLEQAEPIPPYPGEALPSIDLYPVLNQTQAERIFEATFHKDCGDDLVCTSDLSLQARLILKNNQLLLGTHSELRVQIELQNNAEPAYEPLLYIVYPQGLSYVSSKVKQNAQVNCNSVNKTHISCILGNPFKKTTEPVQIILRFDPKSLVDSMDELEFTVFATSTSKELTPKAPTVLRAQVVRKADLSIRSSARPEQVFYGGVPQGEAAMKYRDDVGSPVVHAYEVFNTGPWISREINVEIMWPHQVANNKEKGKWLLYLVDFPTLDSPEKGQCYINHSYVNPLGLAKRSGALEPLMEQLLDPRNHTNPVLLNPSNNRIRRRTRRETEMVVRPEAVIDSEGRRTEEVTMSCSGGGAKCIKFTCKINRLGVGDQALIRISARLWNATLVEDYSQKGIVNIVSSATVTAAGSQKVETISTTKAYADLLEQVDGPAIWIIIVSIVIGLLLLIGLTVLLWKCGFFERRRPDHTLSGNIEKQHREDSPFLGH